jgi:hypothetical protein
VNPAGVVLVLAKAPVAGLAKTRLCPPASPADAAAIAAAALLDTLEHAAAVRGVRVMVAWTGRLADAERRAELTTALAGVEVFTQVPGGLGERIAAAHAEVARRSPGAAVLQIGMDTPQADPDVLATALARLRGSNCVRGADCVLGPAEDGGWWALGLRDPARAAVLAGVPTSRPDTGELTHRALCDAGLDVTALPRLRDVDTATDAHLVAAEAPGTRFAAEVRTRLGLLSGRTR